VAAVEDWDAEEIGSVVKGGRGEGGEGKGTGVSKRWAGEPCFMGEEKPLGLKLDPNTVSHLN